MHSILRNSWALFFGMGMIMLGNGLQGTLVALRASIEDFGTTVTGLVMSGYFIGLIAGCRIIPIIVGRVGHIRTFGALASLASTAILVQAIFVNPWIWWLMRLVTGFSYAGLFIVAESWLNEAADNKTRGKLLSLYMLVSLGGLAGGQFLLNLFPPSSFELFVLVSLLISLAVVPILLSVSKAPQFSILENISIVQLYRVSPLGVFGIFVVGLTYGAIVGMGAVYASDIGLSVKDISLFMGGLILGGFLFQYPLGWLSDTFDPIRVILLSSIVGAIISFVAMHYSPEGPFLYLVATIIGGLVMPLYALCCVQINNYLTPTQMVAASGTIVLINAVGAAIGSPLTAFLMELFGSESFYGSIGGMLSVIGSFALWRYTQRSAVETEEQGDFVVMVGSPMTAALNPDVALDEIEVAAEEDAADIILSFEDLVSDLETEENLSQK